ncbi:MAG: hypothetical protein JNK48_25355 [Bryobacterales bacterium]|nr:hypothetical protein [Bryobacterales bacterium]
MRIGHGPATQFAEQLRAPVEMRPRAPQPVSRTLSGQQASSLELTVTTAEGDKVTLSAQALQAFSLEASPGRRSASSRQELSLSVNVEGELNREELKDIRDLAVALGKSVRQAERGDIGKALRTVSEAADDTIAAFQFRYERRTELEYGQSAYQQVSEMA